MNRRQFLISSGVAASSMAALAGCSGTSDPPPRKSNVIEAVEADNGTLRVQTVADGEQWITSRRELENAGIVDLDSNTTDTNGTTNNTTESITDTVGSATGHIAETGSAILGTLSPVGLAAAKGRGATGRTTGGFRSAPKTPKGRARYYGGAYVGPWYNDHEDEVYKYPVETSVVGYAYLGDNQTFEESAPGPGPVDWDETREPDSDSFEFELQQAGWYRVGTQVKAVDRVVGEGDDPDFGWECVDIRVEENADGVLEVTEEWKVSPRI